MLDEISSAIQETIWTKENLNWHDFTNPSQDDLHICSKHFNLDYYTLADCLEPNHLPKKELLVNYTFIILRYYDKKVKKHPSSIQEMSNKICIFYNEKQIITIHRNPTSIINEVKEKFLEKEIIKEAPEVVTKIMWQVIKTYEDVSINLSKDIDELEKNVFLGKTDNITMEDLYYLKNTCRLNKKILSLSKEIVFFHQTIKKDNSALQDVKDLLQKLFHNFEETFEDANNLSNSYLSIVTQKNNDVMKLLTIFSVFFMPLTFIVGIYGMNFDFMPELRWYYGYPIVLIIMFIISFVIFVWFKKKKII